MLSANSKRRKIVIFIMIISLVNLTCGCATNEYRGFNIVYPVKLNVEGEQVGHCGMRSIHKQKVLVLPFSDNRKSENVVFVYENSLSLVLGQLLTDEINKQCLYSAVSLAKNSEYYSRVGVMDNKFLKAISEKEGADFIVFGSIYDFKVGINVFNENGSEFVKLNNPWGYGNFFNLSVIPTYKIQTKLNEVIYIYDRKSEQIKSFDFTHTCEETTWKDSVPVVTAYVSEIAKKLKFGKIIYDQMKKHSAACFKTFSSFSGEPEENEITNYSSQRKFKIVSFEDAYDSVISNIYYVQQALVFVGLAGGIGWSVNFAMQNKDAGIMWVFYIIPVLTIPLVAAYAGMGIGQLILNISITDDDIYKKGIEKGIVHSDSNLKREDVVVKIKLVNTDF